MQHQFQSPGWGRPNPVSEGKVALLQRCGRGISRNDECRFQAVECNHRHLVKFMVDCGSDVNIADFEDMSAVHVAVVTNELDTAKAVLQYGGNPDHQNKVMFRSLSLSI